MAGYLVTVLASCAADPGDSTQTPGEDELVGEVGEPLTQARPFTQSTLCGVLYKDVNFRGAPLVLTPNAAVSNLGSYGMNDAVSSLRVFRGCTLTGYYDEGYDTVARQFTDAAGSPYPTLGYSGAALGVLENEMTSVRCTCDSAVRDNVCGYVYKDAHFSGDVLPVAKEEYFHNLGQDGLNWNDLASSVNVVGSCVLRTWPNADRSGQELDYPRTSSIQQVAPNDVESSIQADLDNSEGECFGEYNCAPASDLGLVQDEFDCHLRLRGRSFRSFNGPCVNFADF